MSITTDTLKDLPELFSALDTALSLHYFSSITVPKVHDLCEKATQLTKRRVDTTTLELILRFDPKAYQIVHFGLRSLDYGVCLPPGIPPLRFSSLLASRKKSFQERVASVEVDLLPSFKLSEIATPYLKPIHPSNSGNNLDLSKEAEGTLSSPVESTSHNVLNVKLSTGDAHKITKKSPSKVSRLGLSNNLPRFTLKKQVLTGGLSLIERIKLKEKQNKIENSGNSVAENQLLYIKSKAPAVYDILYELTLTGEKKPFKSFPTKKLISIIKDSLSFTMTDDEINDTINEIASVLSEKVKILRVGEINAIKILPLDRNLDLSILNKTI